MTAEFDRLSVGVEAKADGDNVGQAVWADRCKPTKPLPAKVLPETRKAPLSRAFLSSGGRI